MTNLKFWGATLAVGFGLGLGGIFILFGDPPEMAELLQKVNNLLGRNICPEGYQRMFYPGETRIDRCVPKELLVDLPCSPDNQQIIVVELVEIEGMGLNAHDTMCAPRGLNLPQAIRQPLIPTSKAVF